MIIQKLIAVSTLLLALCSAVRAQLPSPTPKITDEVTGSIDGKVVNESGQPLAGASLFIRSVGSQATIRNATSDLDGNFHVNGLERALYTVAGVAPTYTSAVPVDSTTPYYRIGDSVRVELIRGGVITGTVTNSLGEPVIAVRVRCTMIRDANGQIPKNQIFGSEEQSTDDRGIYRIYGVSPGTYLISAGGSGFLTSPTAFDFDIPTFAPSSTRDNAAEVTVRSGEETNVDIRYRGEPGHTISGTVKNSGNNSNTSLTLISAGGSIPFGNTYQFPGARGFAFNGLPDGDYDLFATEATPSPTNAFASIAVAEIRKITVKGSDVTGLELVPKLLGSISGRIALESSKFPECQGKRPAVLAEMVVQLERPEKEMEKADPLTMRFAGNTASPDTGGAFVLRSMMPGRYRFNPRFYAHYWYLQSITTSSAGAKPQKIDAAASWTTLKAGEQLSNLTITLAEGAASVRGRVPVTEGAVLPAGMVVYLMPSEQDKVDDVLRFFVSNIETDGTFAFNNLPPGKYLVLTQTNAEAQTATSAKLRQPEAATARAKLRKTAETKKIEIELKPCQNLGDYQLKQ